MHPFWPYIRKEKEMFHSWCTHFDCTLARKADPKWSPQQQEQEQEQEHFPCLELSAIAAAKKGGWGGKEKRKRNPGSVWDEASRLAQVVVSWQEPSHVWSSGEKKIRTEVTKVRAGECEGGAVSVKREEEDVAWNTKVWRQLAVRAGIILNWVRYGGGGIRGHLGGVGWIPSARYTI